MSGFLVCRLRCRSKHYHFHSSFFSFECHIYVDVVDACVGKNPHCILVVEIVGFHYCISISLCTFQEKKLMYPHFACNACEECQRKLYNGMESYESTNPWVHL